MRKSRKALQIVVRTLSSCATTGWLECGTLRFPCVLGRSGRTTRKREGDGASPFGTWHPLTLKYRADRLRRPRSQLPTQPTRRTDGWCDAANDRNYNRQIKHPYPQSAERLWREDHVYDLIITLDHNTVPRARNHGSAIFIHISRPDNAPTQGCIALKQKHLDQLLTHLHPHTRIKI